METKTRIRGKGHKISPNMHSVVVHLYNPSRQGCTTGSKDFKTTYRFKEIKTLDEALELINHFAESRTGGYISYSMIKKAYYNGVILVLDGQWIGN